jgi:cytochrome P450
MNSAAEIPTLKGRPLLGSMLDFRNRRLHLMRALAARGDLARFWMGPIPVHMVSSAELAHQVLVTDQDKLIKSRGLRVIGRPLLGNGLLTSEHEFHKRQRRLMGPAFTATPRTWPPPPTAPRPPSPSASISPWR